MRIRARATPRPLTGTDGYESVVDAADVGGSVALGRPAPVDLPARRARVARLVGLPLAAALLALWLIVDPRTPDLAAQLYRAQLFGQLGFAVWDSHWYAGHDLPGYSLLFPALATLLGVRTVAVLSVLASAVLFERIVVDAYGPAARWGAVLFAVAAVGDVWIGRLSFALGVPFALGAVLAFMRGRSGWAAVLAALCAASSPVAGLLLALAAVTRALSERAPRALVVLTLPAVTVVLALALLFPEGGTEPYPLESFAATVAVIAAFLLLLPPVQRQLRIGALVYLLACVLFLVLPTPMGSNIERYAVLLAGPLLVCVLATGQRSASRRRATPAIALGLCVIAAWVAWGPVRETVAVAGNESTEAAYYLPVERFLARASAPPAAPVRVEVPLTRSHWEAALLAPTVPLARGWEKQLDERFDHVLLAGGLNAASYGRWLHEEAVSYVALPDTPLDPSSAEEGHLIRRGLPYLREVLVSRHWTIYAVASPTPLASGPGQLTSLGHDSFGLHASSAGVFTVRVHFTRYFALVKGAGCVGASPGGWTSVKVAAPGSVLVAARFSLARALGQGTSCSSSPTSRGGVR